MKSLVISFILCSITVVSKAQNPEKVIRAYLTGYEKKDWNMVASQFADGFTFTSPNHDDHIPLSVYKERCWSTSQYFARVEFSKIMVQGDCAFAIYNIITTNHKVVRNTEYYTFSNGKIKTIECFFGQGPGYPGNTKAN